MQCTIDFDAYPLQREHKLIDSDQFQSKYIKSTKSGISVPINNVKLLPLLYISATRLVSKDLKASTDNWSIREKSSKNKTRVEFI